MGRISNNLKLDPPSVEHINRSEIETSLLPLSDQSDKYIYDLQLLIIHHITGAKLLILKYLLELEVFRGLD